MDEIMGTIKAFGFQYQTKDWMLCQGQILPISQYTALYSLLGTVYGGNGQTTFQLPDLRGRVLVGQGEGPGLQFYVMGQQGGSEAITLIQQQMPMHTHAATATSTSTSTSTSTLNAERGNGTAATPSGKILSGAGAGNLIYAAVTEGQTVTMDPAAIGTTTTTTTDTTVTLSIAGGNLPVAIQQPYLCVNYSICINGIYPSRN